MADDISLAAETPPPQSMTQDHDARCTVTVIRVGEDAAGAGGDLKQLEKRGRDKLTFQSFRFACARQVKIMGSEGGDVLEGLILPERSR